MKTRYLDKTLLNKIKKYKNVENNDDLFSENKYKNFDEKENKTLLENLKKENELLVKQITIKDEQIKDLMKLIDQQQQLTISDKREKENLKSELKIALDHYEYNGEIKNYSEVEKTQQEDSSQPQRTNFQDIDAQRKGFWKKLFGKK